MLERLTIERRLEIFAEAGETSAPLKLWKSQIYKLRKAGFDVDVVIATERRGEYFCCVDWKKPHGHWAHELLQLTIDSLKENCY